nr:hypothetical protein [Tanacetum cinerariifolium]
MMNRFPITLEVLFLNLGVEGSFARIFGTDLVAGRRVSAPLVVVGQDNIGSGNASGLVGNSGDSLRVAGERVSVPVVVLMNSFPITLEVLFRNLGVEGSSARIFGTDLVAGRRVSAPLVVMGQDNLESGNASGLVGNSDDSLRVAGERVSAPVVVVG